MNETEKWKLILLLRELQYIQNQYGQFQTRAELANREARQKRDDKCEALAILKWNAQHNNE